MTRHLLDKPIPKRVLCPVNEELNQPAREADVLGISVLDRCLNPNCNRERRFGFRKCKPESVAENGWTTGYSCSDQSPSVRPDSFYS